MEMYEKLLDDINKANKIDELQDIKVKVETLSSDSILQLNEEIDTHINEEKFKSLYFEKKKNI